MLTFPGAVRTQTLRGNGNIANCCKSYHKDTVKFSSNPRISFLIKSTIVQQPSRHFPLNLAKIPPNQVISDFGRGTSEVV